jgi:predicted ribosome quality control (RQC) complex YloA/Tae2 family protein
MNNYYTLIYLVGELKRKLIGTFFVSAITGGKNVIDLIFEDSNDAVTVRVVASPGNQVLFMDYNRKKAQPNRLAFFSEINSQRVVSIELAESDRLITIRFENGKYLLIVLYGSAANVMLVDDGMVVEAFKNPDRYTGSEELTPRPPMPLTVAPTGDIFRDILKVNPLLPRTFLKNLPMLKSVESAGSDEIQAIAGKLNDILLHRFEPGLNPDGNFNPWPGDILPVAGKEVFDSVNRAVRTAWYSRVKTERFSRKFNLMQKLVSRANDKFKSRLYSPENEDKSKARVLQNERFGHLLMANLHIEPDISGSITVSDLFAGGEVTIPLQPGLTMAENAAYYYEKARKGKKSAKIADESREENQHKARLSEQLLESLNELTEQKEPETLEKWMDTNRQTFEILGLNEEEIEGKGFPFRRIQIGKYDIWIGKSAAGNDELLRASHKEDVWMHARGVSGSHLIIRMNRSAAFPEPAILEKAAGVAAWLSKARTTGIAPVIYAKRKHVRKPKGAAPGLALVDREQVLLVVPAPPESAQEL